MFYRLTQDRTVARAGVQRDLEGFKHALVIGDEGPSSKPNSRGHPRDTTTSCALDHWYRVASRLRGV